MIPAIADRGDSNSQEAQDLAKECDIEHALRGDFQHVHFAPADVEKILEANDR